MARERDREASSRKEGRSRRALLAAAAAGGLGAIAAETVGGAAPAMANDGNPVLQGTDNGTPTKRTAVLTANETGVLADPNTTGKGSLGVYGRGENFGVLGESTGASNVGVQGTCLNGGTGVTGVGGGGYGVQGVGTIAGVLGRGNGGPGVVGTGGALGGNGVEGRVRNASAAGVLAENTAGGNALQVAGKAAFDRSGILTVGQGSSSATQTGIALTSSSFVLATIQGSVAGVYLQGVTRVTGASGSFTIHLNKAVSRRTTVGWLIIN